MIWILVDLSRHGWIHCDQHYQEKNIQLKEHTLLRLLNILNSQTEVTKMRVDATFIDQLFYRAKKKRQIVLTYTWFFMASLRLGKHYFYGDKGSQALSTYAVSHVI